MATTVSEENKTLSAAETEPKHANPYTANTSAPVNENAAPGAPEAAAPTPERKNPYTANASEAAAETAEPRTAKTAAPAPERKNPYAANGSAPARGFTEVKRSNTGWKVFAVIMCLLTVFSITLSALSLGLQAFSLLNNGMIDFDIFTRDVSRENDVTIAGEYKIRSTEQISDAYISGDTSGLSDRDKETLDMAKAVLDKIITPGMTDFEKEKAVYEWLTKELESDRSILTVVPETDEYADSPYGVLKYGNAVCVGYATTFRLLMQMQGINCMVVHDSYLTHSWDLVQLDGEWYHTDCYFDSPAGNFRHFNMDDATRLRDEDWNMDFFPAANGTKYNYAMMNRETLKDIYDLPAWLKAGIEEDKTVLSCGFEDDVEDEAAAEYMLSRLSDAVMWSDNAGDLYMDYIWTQDDDGKYVLCIYLEYYGSSYNYEVSDSEQEKIDEAVEEVFGDFDEWYDGGSDDIVWDDNDVWKSDEEVSSILAAALDNN